MAAPGFTVLPQFQSNLYDLQTKQALAQALMQKGLQGNLAAYQPAGGGYQYVPKYGVGGLLGQLGSALGGALLQRQASEELSNLGQQQWAALTGQGLPQQQAGPDTQKLAAALQGGGGPTNANAAALGATMAAPQQAAQPAPLAPGGMLNPAGLPTNLAAQEYLRDPAKYTEQFVAPYFKPTESTLLGRQAGMTPQQVQDVNAKRAAQIGYIAPVAGGPGQVYRDPLNPAKILAQNPNVGEGMEVVTRADGTQMVIPIQGYTGTVGAIEGARAQGRATGEVQQVFNPKTQQMEIVPRSQVLGGQGGGAGGGLGTGRLGGGGGFAAGPALGVEQAAGVEGTEQAKRGIELDREAGAAPQQRLFIRELRQTMSGFDPGNPKADWALTMKKMVNTANPFGNTFDPHKIASQEQFNKAASQLAMAQFKDLNSGGANSTLETSMNSNPNATISRLGNKGILDLLQGNVDAKERMGQEWQRWKESNGPGSYSKFQTEWSKSYDPQVFMIPYQSKAEAAAMVNAMTPQERKVFQQKFNFAVQNGWIQLPE